MHSLHSLQQMKFSFELKGGTSLSKGFGIIDRFSEDIDIRIEPPAEQNVSVNPKQQRPRHVKSRREFYDWLAGEIMIDGINSVERDFDFDDKKHYRNGGIRLHYDRHTDILLGVRPDVLFEVGFAKVVPNSPRTISSWVYDYAVKRGIGAKDNRVVDVACYHPGYTFVEKPQAISAKFRRQQEENSDPVKFVRHYYDVYRLLSNPEVRNFIGTEDYTAYKAECFRAGDSLLLAENEAFLMEDSKIRENYTRTFDRLENLFYRQRPFFEQIMDTIRKAAKTESI